MRRAHTLAAVGIPAALVSALSLQARPAHAYSFVDEIPEDACARARSFEPQDTSPGAQHARRACRLQVFEQRMAEERRQTLAAQQKERDAVLERWIAVTQPIRVQRPMAVEAFAGSGIANYGLSFSWNVVSSVELAVRAGQRQMSCADQFSGTGADCTRTTWGGGVRWIMLENTFSPFLGTAFSSTSAPLQIVQPSPEGGGEFLQGKGNAHSLSGSAGLQLATGYVRLSLEYLYEHLFYTGANLNDQQRTPSEALRVIWEDSLSQDRHGIRFQVGVAF
jgi:hypothetical protein